MTPSGWNSIREPTVGYQFAFLGVSCVLLLTVLVGLPSCSVGTPFTPQFAASQFYNYSPGDVVIVVSRGGGVSVNGSWRCGGGYPTIPKPATGRHVIIVVDRQMPLRVVNEALAAARAAGVEHVVLRTRLPDTAWSAR